MEYKRIDNIWHVDAGQGFVPHPQSDIFDVIWKAGRADERSFQLVDEAPSCACGGNCGCGA